MQVIYAWHNDDTSLTLIAFSDLAAFLGGAGAQLGYRQDLQFPKQYINSTVFVAEHGLPDNPMQPGFRVAAVNLDNPLYGTSALTHINFASGWLSSDGPWGELPILTRLCMHDVTGFLHAPVHQG